METLENVEDPKESTSNITHRIKRSRVEAWENIEDPKGSMSNGSLEQNLGKVFSWLDDLLVCILLSMYFWSWSLLKCTFGPDYSTLTC